MVTAQELRNLCLLAAASSLAKTKPDVCGLKPMYYGIRCALYMLVAFSLSRQNLGRRALRPSPANPNPPRSASLRFGPYRAAAFRARIRARLSSFSPSFLALPHKGGCLAILYR